MYHSPGPPTRLPRTARDESLHPEVFRGPEPALRCSLLRRPPPGGSWQEPVADAVHGQEMTRDFGISLQLLPEPDHMRVHSPSIGKRLVAPHRVENHVTRQRPSRILQEKREQIEFGARHA